MPANPLDRLFFALDDAWRRCGLPGADIHLYFQLGDAVDAERLAEALRRLHAKYPAANARRGRCGLPARPVWLLPEATDAAPPPVSVERLEPDTPDELRARQERLLNSRRDYASNAPLSLHILRSDARGDTVVARWPHALADARGGVTLVEELAELYDDLPPLSSLDSADDERRRDFGAVELPAGAWSAARRFLRRTAGPARPARWNEVRLCPPALPCDEPARLFHRALDADESARVREAATRVCGFARTADFLRACVVRAVDETAGRPRGAHDGYTTMHILDHRRRRDPGPVCHNVFSSVPVHVPAALAPDRRAVANLIRDHSAAVIASGLAEQRMAGLALLCMLPHAWLVDSLASARRGGRSLLPLGLGGAPSAPMGFMGPLSRPRTRLFGAPLHNLYGVWSGSPRAGFSLHINVAQDGMNVAGLHYESQMPTARMDALVERVLAAMADPIG